MLTKTFPAATGENLAYTYDSTTGGNKGVGRVTSITDQSGSTAIVYNARQRGRRDSHHLGPSLRDRLRLQRGRPNRADHLSIGPYRRLCPGCAGQDLRRYDPSKRGGRFGERGDRSDTSPGAATSRPPIPSPSPTVSAGRRDRSPLRAYHTMSATFSGHEFETFGFRTRRHGREGGHLRQVSSGVRREAKRSAATTRRHRHRVPSRSVSWVAAFAAMTVVCVEVDRPDLHGIDARVLRRFLSLQANL